MKISMKRKKYQYINVLPTRACGMWPPAFLVVDLSNIGLYLLLKCLSTRFLPLLASDLSRLAASKSSFVNTTIIGTIVG